MQQATDTNPIRLDKWLWAARFFKTRSLAQAAIAGAKVKVNDDRVKPAFDLKVGDAVVVRVGDYEWRVIVKGLSERRGPAVQARLLYEETAESRAERERRIRARVDAMLAGGLTCDWREPDVIRLAPAPLYNSYEDCWRAVELIERLLSA